MNLLVIGASGMAGHLITTYLKEQGHNVSTLSAHHPYDNQTTLIDVSKFSLLEAYLSAHTFDTVINCAGMLIKAAEENKSKAVLVNSHLPHYLQDFYAYTTTKVIHLSTDCVFSGEHGPYVESAPQDGTLFYDKSKALGELNNAKDLTLRMSIIGPDRLPNGVGLLNWFLQQEGTISGYTKVYWNGITTLELAKAISFCLTQPLTGLYHLVPQEPISKYNLLMLFKQTFNKSQLMITPSAAPIFNKVLINTRQDLSYVVADYPTMLQELYTWIKQHAHFYPHYKL